jgi:hypothetical protein
MGLFNKNPTPHAKVLDVYGLLDDFDVRVMQHPRRAIVDFRLDGKQHQLQFDSPDPLTSLMAVFDDCWNIRIFDRNVEEPNCLEYGRYRVELWSEDDPLSQFIVNRFEHIADD